MTRIAVLGAGAWGANHVRVVASEPRCELASVVDHDPAVCERMRARAPTSRDPDGVLADPSIDAVIIATPAPSHVDLACAALHAGKHVLVEKPCALSLDGARRIAAVAAERRRTCMVGHLLVFHPAVVRMREAVRGGDFGQLLYVHSVRANVGRIRPDESVLWSFGPHELSILDHLLEQVPVSVTARGRCLHHPGVEDVAFVTIQYATGELAELHLSRVHPHKERTLSVVGSRQVLRFDDISAEKLRIFTGTYERPPSFGAFSEYLDIRHSDVVSPPVAMAEPLSVQLQHFLDSIETGRPSLTDIASGVRITRILEAGQRSLATDGRPVPVERA